MRVAGVDSSTQSVKVIVLENGEIIRRAAVAHPSGTQVNPELWWSALQEAINKAGGIADCAAVSIAAQQHGLICLDSEGNVLRDALLWNDVRSADAAEALIAEKSSQFWAQACGSVPVASLTVSKLRWMADNEPETVNNIAAICLPHDWLTWKLRGSADIHDLVTDRSDVSGTGYADCRSGEYRYDLLACALRMEETAAHRIVLPRVASPFEIIGKVAARFGNAVLAPGCGDNAAAALGLGLRVGQAAVSLGTSGVISCVSDDPVCDETGAVTGFMDASGKWLPLVCTLNGSRIVDYVKQVLGVDYAEFDKLVAESEPGNLVLIPYFNGERTPNLPYATASFHGMTPYNMSPQCFARAAAEGMCCLMRGAAESMKHSGVVIENAFLIGGGAKSDIIAQMMANIMGIPIIVPEKAEYVALGAARQANRTLDTDLGPWKRETETFIPLDDGGAWERYAAYVKN